MHTYTYAYIMTTGPGRYDMFKSSTYIHVHVPSRYLGTCTYTTEGTCIPQKYVCMYECMIKVYMNVCCMLYADMYIYMCVCVYTRSKVHV